MKGPWSSYLVESYFFFEPLVTSSIRIYKQTYYSSSYLRVGVYGCDDSLPTDDAGKPLYHDLKYHRLIC